MILISEGSQSQGNVDTVFERDRLKELGRVWECGSIHIETCSVVTKASIKQSVSIISTSVKLTNITSFPCVYQMIPWAELCNDDA